MNVLTKPFKRVSREEKITSQQKTKNYRMRDMIDS